MEYRILRSRRKTVAIQITPEGEVLIRCPMQTPNRDIEQIVESRREWISTHLARISRRPPVPVLTEQELKALSRQAASVIPEKCIRYAAQMGVTYGRITIRRQRTRWGSCSGKGNLNFNCLLMLAPDAVQDYVVVHELCHRKQMNHSPQFWAEVSAVLPDYAVQKRWLKAHGASLMARLPKE